MSAVSDDKSSTRPAESMTQGFSSPGRPTRHNFTSRLLSFEDPWVPGAGALPDAGTGEVCQLTVKSLKLNWPVTPAAWEVAMSPVSWRSAMPGRVAVGPTLVHVVPFLE